MSRGSIVAEMKECEHFEFSEEPFQRMNKHGTCVNSVFRLILESLSSPKLNEPSDTSRDQCLAGLEQCETCRPHGWAPPAHYD